MAKIILYFISITLGVAAVVTALLTAQWSIVLIFGLIFMPSILVINRLIKGKKINYWQQRSTQNNAINLVTIAFVLAVLGAVNFLAIKYNNSWDLTENQIYTLSSLSQTIVGKLEKPLDVLVFDRSLDPNLKSLLENYRFVNPKFQFEIIDPERELGLAKEYQVESLGDVYLQYGVKRQKLNRDNSNLGTTITETELTNAIAKIQRDRPINIYFLQGHGEATDRMVEGGIAQIVRNLENRGQTVNQLNLASTGKIPQDADLIVIAGAKRKLLEAEVEILEEYLIAGGNLLLLLVPNLEIGLEPLLTDWGVELDDRLILDGSGAGEVLGFGPGVVTVNNYGEHPIAANLTNGTAIFPESRPLKLSDKPEISSTPLATTSERTWAESDLKNEEIIFDPQRDLPGPLNIAIALERQKPSVSRMVVFGSLTFATNGWFEQQFNGDLILNSISWLVGEDRAVLDVRPRETANRRIELSVLQVMAIDWLAWRIIPLMALSAGIVLWLKRR